jgi:hypothetical protein
LGFSPLFLIRKIALEIHFRIKKERSRSLLQKQPPDFITAVKKMRSDNANVEGKEENLSQSFTLDFTILTSPPSLIDIPLKP